MESLDVYIIGTGGAAKEIIQLLEQVNATKPAFSIVGFVDVAPTDDIVTFFGKSYKLIDESVCLKSYIGASVIVAHGLASVRARIFAAFSDFLFPNLIHPVVDIHSSVHMGRGNIIKMGCLITTDISIGDNNYINRGVQIGHDVIIGHSNVLNPGCIVSGGVEMGSENNIGANATILQYRKLGDSNTLGAGGVLVDDATDANTLLGIPAK